MLSNYVISPWSNDKIGNENYTILAKKQKQISTAFEKLEYVHNINKEILQQPTEFDNINFFQPWISKCGSFFHNTRRISILAKFLLFDQVFERVYDYLFESSNKWNLWVMTTSIQGERQ